MNDYDAMEAIHEALDEYFCSDMTMETLVHRIAYISGQNKIDHGKAKEQS